MSDAFVGLLLNIRKCMVQTAKPKLVYEHTTGGRGKRRVLLGTDRTFMIYLGVQEY
jgi:hypothetical protein